MTQPPVHLVVRAALSALLSLAAGLASAGPSQASMDAPGGFASACASEISSGISYTPGLDLTASFAGWAGRSQCASQVFGGEAGQAAAAATWTTAAVQNSSAATVGMGHIHLQAANRAPSTVQFPVGVAGAGWSEAMVVNLAGHSGESAVWLFDVAVDGHLAVSAGSARVTLNAYKNEIELMNNVSGFNRGASDPVSTDRQRVVWGQARSGSRDVDDRITFAVPVTIGQSFVWGVYATAWAGLAGYGPGGPLINTTADVDFLHTLRYAGSAGVMVGGVRYDNAQLLAASGIDWTSATPVPEPASGLLLLAGLAWLAARRRLT